jgi:hypothetical protein
MKAYARTMKNLRLILLKKVWKPTPQRWKTYAYPMKKRCKNLRLNVEKPTPNPTEKGVKTYAWTPINLRVKV